MEHPHQYLYFNEAFGGIKNAYGNYETDYWMNATKPMATWFKEHKKEVLASGKPITIATDCVDQVKYEIADLFPNVKVSYMRYHNRSAKAWDYAFFVTRYIDPGFLKSGWYADEQAIYTEKIAGTPIGCILERRDSSDYLAVKEMQSKTAQVARLDSLLLQAIKANPHNEGAIINLANIYLQTNRLPEAKKQIDGLLAAAPHYTEANQLLGKYYIQQNDAKNALVVYAELADSDPRNTEAVYYKALLQAQTGDKAGALESIEIGLQYAGSQQAADFLLQLQQQIYKK
jgi:tetratricopeptide (TPR) repeat protein